MCLQENVYLCTMEESYLYPNQRITPVEIGDGYEDYLLSDVLRNEGFCLSEVVLHFSCGPVLDFDRNNSPVQLTCFVAEGKLKVEKKSVAFAPMNSGLYPFSPRDIYRDLRIRYYIRDGFVSRPVWVSVFSGKEELVPGGDIIPSCETLLSGSLFFVRDDYDEHCGMHSDVLVRIE